MKAKMLLSVVMILTCINSAVAQGQFWFYNFGGNLDAPVSDQFGNLISDTNGIYKATAAWASGFDQNLGNLQPISGLAEDFLGFGYFIRSTPVHIPGTSINQPITLVFRAWDTRSGDAWETAWIRGQSDPFNYSLFGGINPGTVPNLDAFSTLPQAFALAIVPEPSTYIIILIGLFAVVAGRMRSK